MGTVIHIGDNARRIAMYRAYAQALRAAVAAVNLQDERNALLREAAEHEQAAAKLRMLTVSE